MRIEFRSKSPQKGNAPRPPPKSVARNPNAEEADTSTYSMDYSPSQTTPIAGRHKKSISLVGFDPLLMDTSKQSKSNDKITTLSFPVLLAPHPAEERDQQPSSPATSLHELRSELRAIASEIGRLSSNQRAQQKSLSEENEKSPMKVTPTSKALTPTRIGRWNRATAGMTPPVVKNKKPSLHRKTKSLDSSDGKNAAKSAIDPPPLLESPAPVSSTIMQELWEIQQKYDKTTAEQEKLEALALPTLAKPRPTSFLTGTEIHLTSELDATEWQVEIPAKEEFEFTTRVSLFLESYRKEECLLDLSSLVGCGRQDLGYFASGQLSQATEKIGKFHRPIVESLLECGNDLLQVQGYFRSKSLDDTPNGFREVLVLERQRQFLCCFRGTTNEQLGKVGRQPDTIKLLDNGGVSVFRDRYEAAAEFEPRLFGLLDRLMEENPFCDFLFCGHGFGAAMATLTGYRYAWARPELRVATLVSGSAKVGLNDFRLSAHSLGNFKVARLELGHIRYLTPSGFHIGHTIRINPSKSNGLVRAYRFADSKPDPSPIRKLRLNRDRNLAEYVMALEELDRKQWVKDFYRQDGAGVRGKDNESRFVV